MSTLRQDIRFALRTLLKSPMFTIVAVASLALGIGVNTALFSFLDHLLLRSLPVREPERLVLLDATGPVIGMVTNEQAFSYGMYRDIRDRNDVFEGTLARFETAVSVTWKNQTEAAAGELVSGNYFDVLGLNPHIGRLFRQTDDETPGAHPVVVLGHGYWTRRFGADPAVVGQKVLINGNPMEVVGVAPPRFHGVLVGNSMDVYVPLMMKAQITPTWNGLDSRQVWWLNVFARLKPDVTAEQAKARLAPLHRQLLEDEFQKIDAARAPANFRGRYIGKELKVLPGYRGRSWVRDRMEKPFLVLMCMVGLVLLIACANIANLLIARAAARQREIAIRLALGASRWQLMRQLIVESTVLALAGGSLGVLVAVWAGDLIAGFVMSGPGTEGLAWSAPDYRTLAFTFSLAVLTAIVFGLVPAWKATRPTVAVTLKDQAGSVSSAVGDVRLRKGLVVAQIALSLLLLFGAGLFARSLYNLRSIDPGFETDNLVTFTVDPALNGYTPQRSFAIFEQIQNSLQGLPGVRSVAMADNAVLTGNITMRSIQVEGYTRSDGENMSPDVNGISPAYMGTLGIRLLEGRDFTEADKKNAPKVVIINQVMAEKYFKGRSAVGRRIGFGHDEPNLLIVGVVGNVRGTNLRDANRRFVYFPYTATEKPGSLTYYVRAAGAPEHLIAAVRREVQRIDATLPVTELKTMEAQVSEALSIDRAVAVMSAFFGLLATALAAIGLYGVMAYTVTRRTREIGIRVALGAERRTVIWMVLREVAIMSSIGMAIGVPASMALSKYVEAQVYGMPPQDPLTLSIAAGVMLTIAFLAGYMPASRAARVDPIQALRYE
jgi:predicted permease